MIKPDKIHDIQKLNVICIFLIDARRMFTPPYFLLCPFLY